MFEHNDAVQIGVLPFLLVCLVNVYDVLRLNPPEKPISRSILQQELSGRQSINLNHMYARRVCFYMTYNGFDEKSLAPCLPQ